MNKSQKTKQEITIPQREYQKLKKQYNRLGEILKKVEEDKQKGSKKEAAKRLLEKINKGYKLGSLKYKHRSELHRY